MSNVCNVCGAVPDEFAKAQIQSLQTERDKLREALAFLTRESRVTHTSGASTPLLPKALDRAKQALGVSDGNNL